MWEEAGTFADPPLPSAPLQWLPAKSALASLALDTPGITWWEQNTSSMAWCCLEMRLPLRTAGSGLQLLPLLVLSFAGLAALKPSVGAGCSVVSAGAMECVWF